MTTDEKISWIVVTGATGYVGSRLVPMLLDSGHRVRAVSRSLQKLKSRVWANHPNVELAEAEMSDVESIHRILQDCSAAYYFVHSMNSQNSNFAEKDREAANNFVSAADECSVERIIYLGGLGIANADLSKHLQSRHEVADILSQSKIPTTILRAAMIIGSGSTSFEILRYLVERLPVMITPRWVSTPCQPIAIRNVLHFLLGCLDNDATTGGIFDIGGPEVLTYAELMQIYAEEAHLKRRFIVPVPVFTPRLSSYWIHFVTPVPSYIARPLAEGLRNPVVCQESRINGILPQPLLDCRSAIRIALEKIQHHQVPSRWTDAGRLKPAEWCTEEDPIWAGGTVYSDIRRIGVHAGAEELWKPLVRLGGENGWYYGNWLWWLRGIMDLFIGGVGLRRGRRHPSELYPGDVLDFWRVQAVVPNERLLLTAEMKVPGEAVLEFRLVKTAEHTTDIIQIAKFHPSGLTGILYWYLVMPLHHFVFTGMLRGIATASERQIISGPEKLEVSPKYKSAAQAPKLGDVAESIAIMNTPTTNVT
jgi:uncharacterized protein YbjT (DUF2867 family)